MPDDIHYGPDNPHPLSTRKTELIWEGKYDEYGNRREVDIAGAAMPLQKIETVDEPRARAEGQQLRFDTEKAHRDDFRNMLIWGDNKLVMASLLKNFKGQVDLIYIDPPFDVGADFTLDVAIGNQSETIEKDQSVLEMVAYRDMWGRGTDSYLHIMYERLAMMAQLLTDDGSIFVHCDWHAGYLLRLLLDEIFARQNFKNEIVWWYYNKLQGNINRFASNHDTILWYSKGDKYRFGRITEPRKETKRQQKRVWDPETKSLKQARDEQGNLLYYDVTERTLDDVWRVPYLMPANVEENLRYDTQKPEELATRILTATTEPDDLVADFFCGAGTVGAAAERLGRRWIMCDLGRFAIHTSRKRLIEVQRGLHGEGKAYRSFDVYNLGRYERQWWQKTQLNGADGEHRRVVLEFYRAEPLTSSPSPLLHGRKGQTLVHVDTIDTILTREEVTSVAMAAKEAGAREIACLSWEFEMDLRLTCNALEQELEVKIKLIPIPREIMEKNRKEPPPFLEVATLGAEPVLRDVSGKKVVDIKLTRFLPSLAEAPTKELMALKERAVESGFDFIDFWSVDFDYKDSQPFNHDWQAYRTRKDRSLLTVSNLGYEYSAPGPHTACVKVIDIFGCDTSITVEVPL